MDIQLIQSWYRMIYDEIHGTMYDALMAVLLCQVIDNRPLSQTIFQVNDTAFTDAKRQLASIMHKKFPYL
jgi:hypothetical protein